MQCPGAFDSSRRILIAAIAALLFAAPLAAQTNSSAVVSGTVRSPDGRPVPQAIVTLTPVGSGSAVGASTTTSGTFLISLVQPGSYEIRVEALGYRPVVARLLTVGGGETRSVNLTLNPAAPPVVTVDTVSLGGAASSRWRAGGVQLGGNDVDGLPSRFEDLATIASISTAFDGSLGSQGLPGEMTLVIVDGIPFYRAPHPSARAEFIPDGLFPRSTISGLTASHNGSDIEWSGAAGGYLGLATRSSTQDGGLELDGSYSGDPTWSSSELDLDTPSLLSYQGGLRGTVALSPNAQVVLSGEALRQQTPLTPRIDETLASDLVGLDPDLITSLSEAGVETYSRYSGMARFDVQRSRTSQIFFRGAGAYSVREFDGAGPLTLAGAASPAEESLDFSTALGVVSQSSRNVTLEFRAGVSGSYREFGASIAGVPPAYLASSGRHLGDAASAFGESSRTDFVMIPVVRYTPGATTLKFGATIRASNHTMAHSYASLGDFLYSDAGALLAGQGFGLSTSAPEESFGTQEYGVFAQYESTLAPGLELTLGGRYDYELIGGDGGSLNTDWFTATGLSTTDFKDGFHQFGANGTLVWDPTATGSTRVMISGSMREGDVDPRSLYQVFAEDTDGTATRFSGSGIDWPAGGIPPLAAPALPSFTLLGPDTRAPRSTNLSASVTQRVSDALTVFVRGSMRRTDFLMRRRNLNIPLVPQALDPDGRRIYGSLDQDGSLVTTTSDDGRRFSEFGAVWALDPDGWSEYTGLTAGVEHITANVDIFGSYTYSETTDNWVGAASGVVGASLDPGLPGEGDDPSTWSEGISDFDAPHRAVAAATVRAGAVTVSGVYRFSSGVPFTPRYRIGVDANGDGSVRNDVTFLPDVGQLGGVGDSWSCVSDQAEGFAARNSCRAADRHSVDARVQFRIGRLAGRVARLSIDAFNLVEPGGGVIDDALLLVDPAGSITTSPDGTTVTIPFTVNQDFGRVLYPSSRGRMLQIGVRIGG